MNVGTVPAVDKQGFLANQAEILKKFGARAPESTTKGGGLLDQSAVIVALRPDRNSRRELAGWARGVPGAFAYGAGIQHGTIGVRDATKGEGAELNPVRLREQLRGTLETLSGVAQQVVATHRSPSFGQLRIVANVDSVIGAVEEPSDELWEVRQEVLDGASDAGVELNPSWGLHLTLDRFIGPLDDAQLQEFDRHLQQAPVVTVTAMELLVGFLVVRNEAFSLHYHTTFAFSG